MIYANVPVNFANNFAHPLAKFVAFFRGRLAVFVDSINVDNGSTPRKTHSQRQCFRANRRDCFDIRRIIEKILVDADRRWTHRFSHSYDEGQLMTLPPPDTFDANRAAERCYLVFPDMDWQWKRGYLEARADRHFIDLFEAHSDAMIGVGFTLHDVFKPHFRIARFHAAVPKGDSEIL